MSELPPPAPDTGMSYQNASFVDRDQEHLNILKVCWYIVSGFSALFGFFPLIYVVLGVIVASGSMSGSSGGSAPPEAMGLIFAIFGGCFSLFIWVGSVLSFLTARAIGRRRRIVLCYITAGLACLSIPIGTTLGIFTFLVLSRASVKATFA